MNSYPPEVVEQSGIQNIIVCAKNRRCFRLLNKHKYFVQKIKVDNGLIKSGIRCDYAVDICATSSGDCPSNRIYLIELKGVDKDHASRQILESFNFFNENYSTCIYYCRIILSKDHAPKLLTPNQKRLLKLEKQNKINLLIRSQIIEEVL